MDIPLYPNISDHVFTFLVAASRHASMAVFWLTRRPDRTNFLMPI